MSDEQLPASSPRAKPISAKAQRFAEEYAWSEDLNATKAAVRAGYKEKSARKTASDLLRDPRVKARIAEHLKERSEQTRVKAALALEELAVVMRSSVDHFMVTPDGYLEAKAGAPEGAIRAISHMKRRHKQFVNSKGRLVDQFEVEFKLYDKNSAITNALKHLGLLKDVVETRDLTLEALILEAAQRGDGTPTD